MEKLKLLNRRLWWGSVLVLTAVLTIVLGFLVHCGAQPAKRVTVAAPPVPVVTPTPAPPGPPAPAPGPSGGKPQCADVTTFAQLQPVLGLNCLSCHPGFNAATMATGKVTAGPAAGTPLIDEVVRRVNLKADDADHMPAQRPQLSASDIGLFASWKADGFLGAADCTQSPPPPTPPPPTVVHDFAWVEQAADDDANRLTTGDQPTTRYFWAAGDQAVAKDALNKALNSVSSARARVRVATVTPGVWRVNLTDLRLTSADWTLVENASQLQLESKTQRGLELKNILKTRIGVMSVQDFADTALHNSTVYYALTRAPGTANELFAQKGVDFSGDLAAFRAELIGFNGSRLSPAANRMVARFVSNDGTVGVTFDTGKIVSDLQSVFSHPELAQAGGNANFKFAAGEIIYSLPNGLDGYFLALAKQVFKNVVVTDNQGVQHVRQVFDHTELDKRLDQADPAVVSDYRASNPLRPTIISGISCYGCHTMGRIAAVDKVLPSIGDQNIGAQDTLIVQGLYKPQTTNDQHFAEDNARYGAALTDLGLSPGVDPISLASDVFLGDLEPDFVAQLLGFGTVDALNACLNISVDGKKQIGQLQHGGKVSHDQLVTAVPVLKVDCRIGQDPL